MNVPQIVVGRVHHRRLRPVPHALTYRCWFLLLPLRRMREVPDIGIARNRRALVSFFDADHGDGAGDCLAWVESLLAAHGHDATGGEVWLQTMPRVLGHVFNPVSFWYCHAADGRLQAIVVEVNNTFGERHCYLLDGPQLAWGREQLARKVFHVSPFCAVSGSYRFRFLRNPRQTMGAGPLAVRIAHDDESGPLLLTSVSGHAQALTPAGLRRALLRMPLAVLGVVGRIHWHALRLWLKQVPWFAHREGRVPFVTR